MVKRARIVHGNNNVDFAPGVNNVIKRVGDVNFYAVETFHSSPFYNRVIPVFASDVNSSHDVIEIYGSSGMKALYDKVILLNNHPIRKVKMVGRITEYFIKEIRKHTYYFISIDDTSGSEMLCKVSSAVLMAAGLNHQGSEGLLIEVSGAVSYNYEKYELHVETLSLMDNGPGYLSDELMFWQEAVTIRNVLKTPWFQSLQIDQESGNPVYRLDKETHKRKVIEQGITLSSFTDNESTVVLDSSIYIRKNAIKNYTDDEDSYVESPTELQEGTNELFEKRGTPVELYSSQPRSLDKGWIEISSVSNLENEKKFNADTGVLFMLIKWIIKNKSPQFMIDKPYKDPYIFQFLKVAALKKFPVQVVDLTLPNAQIKTVNEIYGELFHEARHTLQRWQLLRCTRSKNCYASALLDFHTFLLSAIQFVKENSLCLNLRNIITSYNNKNNTKVHMDSSMLEMVVFWVLNRQNDSNWRFDPVNKKWTYSSS